MTTEGDGRMNTDLPSDAELDTLALQVDDQLNELQSQPAREVEVRGVEPGKRTKLPAAPQQQAVIERATGEPFENFWEKFKRHARQDLCLPGGHLYQQWEKWRDLRSKDSVKVAFGVIAGMGIPTASIAPVAVAASVFLLNAVTNIGVQAICEGCAEEEAERKKTVKEASKDKRQRP
jgi:hypothetical protein